MSNVRALGSGGDTAESILRDALSQCAEIRSRDKTPHVIVMCLEEGYCPGIGRTEMLITDLAVCAQTLGAIASHEIVEDLMDVDA